MISAMDNAAVNPINTVISVVSRTARRAKPLFSTPVTKQLRIKKRLAAALKKKDFNKDTALRELRENGGKVDLYYLKSKLLKTKFLPVRRSNIRVERIESLRELGFAFIEHCDYSVDSEFLFEISYSPETLAKMIGQHHVYPPSKQYPNGRTAYDCVLNAIYDYEASKQIVVAREYDEAAGTNKASRIFLTPIFFKMLGVKKSEMLDLLRDLKRVKKLNGKREGNKQFIASQAERRTKHGRVAGVKRSDIKKILRSIKSVFVEAAKPVPIPAKIPLTDNVTKDDSAVNLSPGRIIAKLKAKLAPAVFYIEKAKVDLMQLTKDAAEALLITNLKQHV